MVAVPAAPAITLRTGHAMVIRATDQARGQDASSRRGEPVSRGGATGASRGDVRGIGETGFQRNRHRLAPGALLEVLHFIQADVLGGARSRRQARRAPAARITLAERLD